LRVGIFGLWGMNIPGIAFGGFETVYSEVGAKLAERGHDVVMYCRRERYPVDTCRDAHRGVRLKYVASIDTKNLSAVTATWMAVIDSLRSERFDVHLFANVGMGFHCLALKLFRKRVVLNVDGLDWLRAKWNPIAKLYFQLACRAALRSCDVLIADSRAMQEYYAERFGTRPTYITYGAHLVQSADPAILDAFGVQPRHYLLVVSRFVPENNLHMLIEAFERTSTDLKLLVVGGTNHPTDYESLLRQHESERILFPGYISDRAQLNELFCNCYAYLHGHSVGGTNPALLDALGCGCCVLAVNTRFNAEVLANGEFGFLFDPDTNSARGALKGILLNPNRAAQLRNHAPDRISEAYNWDKIVDEYEALFRQLVLGKQCPDSRAASAADRPMCLATSALGARIDAPMRSVDSTPWDTAAHTPVPSAPRGPTQRLVKRSVDVIGASVLVVLLCPISALIALAIKLTSPGPVLYRWPVVGQQGKPLKAYKFRTMVLGADDMKKDLLDRSETTGPVFKMKDDPRVTTVGRFLRKFSLDELPQLWSVLKGDMSLVGPRPVLTYEWEQFEDWQRRKLSVQPGAVCLWHVRGQPRDFEEWIKLDLEYIDNWSLWLDLKILLGAAVYMITGKNY
jgi:lipopolysaccharide/colanic/teichoic acid biosynthesis glycosyltransferase/glycosyltransferase involved in cell wall biosynthesis